MLAVPIDSDALAAQMGISYENFIRVLGRLAEAPAWFCQWYHCVIFLRYRRAPSGKCGHPQYYVISRHSLHRIGGEPGRQVRTRLRKKTAGEWIDALKRVKILALAIIYGGRKAADDKHKGFTPLGKQAGPLARPPPTENLPASRFLKLAAALQGKFNALPASPRINLIPWAAMRFAESHSFARIEACLRHAVQVMPAGRFAPENRPGWICGVATRHLEADGLGPYLREWTARGEKAKRQRADARAFNELRREPAAPAGPKVIICKYTKRELIQIGGTWWEENNTAGLEIWKRVNCPS